MRDLLLQVMEVTVLVRQEIPDNWERILIIDLFTLIAAILDIDECQNNLGGCTYSCYNTIGSFTCDCMPGYALANDNSTCNGERELIISTYV